MILLPLVLVFIDTEASENINPWTGVSMEQKASIESMGQLICDNHQRILSLSYLNDDYCDCKDGADEPGTSACSHIASSTDYLGMFHCHNEGYYAKSIPTAWVNDHVCDCCDGSDEYIGSMNCSNTCSLSAAHTIESLHEELQQVQAGLETRNQWTVSVPQILVEKQQKLGELEQERKVQEAALADARTQKYHQDKAKRVELMKTLGLMDFSSPIELNEIILELMLAMVDHHHPSSNGDKEKSPEEQILSILSRHREYAQLDDRVSVIEQEEREFQQQQRASRPDHDREDNSEDKAPFDEEEEWKHENDGDTDEDEKEASGPMRSLLNEVSLLSYGTANGIDETQEDISSTLSKLDQEMESIQAMLADTTGYGPDQMYLKVLNECVSTQAGQYKYEMCFYGNAKQDSVSLGKWAGFSADGKKVSFEGGQKCWNGPARSLHLELECGSDMKLYQIDEIEICVYTGKLILPFACTPEAVEELELEIKRLAGATVKAGHDEL